MNFDHGLDVTFDLCFGVTFDLSVTFDLNSKFGLLLCIVCTYVRLRPLTFR